MAYKETKYDIVLILTLIIKIPYKCLITLYPVKGFLSAGCTAGTKIALYFRVCVCVFVCNYHVG